MEYLNIAFNGHRVHYCRTGNGPPVVLLHGAASDSRDWAGTMAGLAHRHSLYAPDLIGFGRSDRKPDGYYLSDFTEFMVAFIAALDLERPVLVGHSFGGRVCLEVARLHPEKIAKLVLVDAAGLGRTSPLGNLLLTGFYAARQVSGRPQPFPRFLSRDGEDDYWSNCQGLADIRTPTLLIWKRFDPYLPLSLARRARAAIPGARLAVMPGYGHAPHHQNRGSFKKVLLDFLAGD